MDIYCTYCRLRELFLNNLANCSNLYFPSLQSLQSLQWKLSIVAIVTIVTIVATIVTIVTIVAFVKLAPELLLDNELRLSVCRFFWLFAIAMGVLISSLLIGPAYHKWNISPTYTSIRTTNYPVWKMAFPGVTICSNLVIHPDRLRIELDENLR